MSEVEHLDQLIQDKGLSPEELGELAARVLNQTGLSVEVWDSFRDELDDSNMGELIARIANLEE